MKTTLLLFSFLTLLTAESSFLHADDFKPIVLGVPEFKPYTFLHDGKIKGSAINQFQEVAKSAAISYSLKHYANYSLLLKALKKNEIQGFFLATKNSERDRYAEFSRPLAFNNWSWFVRDDFDTDLTSSKFIHNSIVATIPKTNTFRWLTRNGYQVHTDTRLKLPYLLLSKKVDAVFIAEAVFEDAYQELSIDKQAFKKVIEVKRPFSMYISKQYLQDNSGFMNRLNNAIPYIQ